MSDNSDSNRSYTTNVEIIELRNQINQLQLMIIQSGYRELDMQSKINHLSCQVKDSQDHNYKLSVNIQHYASVISHQNNIIKDLQHKYYWLYNNYNIKVGR
jgi:hypothetical protein